MVKLLSIILLLLAFSMPAFSQYAATDQARDIALQLDLKNFKLDNETWKQFRHNHFAPTSDHFKPVKANVGDTTFLADSVYVKAFREGAYKKTLHRHTTGHSILLIGGITTGILLIVVVIVGSTLSWHMNLDGG